MSISLRSCHFVAGTGRTAFGASKSNLDLQLHCPFGGRKWWNSNPWFLKTYCWQKVFLHQYVWYMKQTDWRFLMYDKMIDATLAEQPNRRDVCSCWPLLIVNNHPELQHVKDVKGVKFGTKSKFLLSHNVLLFFEFQPFLCDPNHVFLS